MMRATACCCVFFRADMLSRLRRYDTRRQRAFMFMMLPYAVTLIR